MDAIHIYVLLSARREKKRFRIHPLPYIDRSSWVSQENKKEQFLSSSLRIQLRLNNPAMDIYIAKKKQGILFKYTRL
jgi:hypothetical protein